MTTPDNIQPAGQEPTPEVSSIGSSLLGPEQHNLLYALQEGHLSEGQATLLVEHGINPADDQLKALATEMLQASYRAEEFLDQRGEPYDTPEIRRNSLMGREQDVAEAFTTRLVGDTDTASFITRFSGRAEVTPDTLRQAVDELKTRRLQNDMRPAYGAGFSSGPTRPWDDEARRAYDVLLPLSEEYSAVTCLPVVERLRERAETSLPSFPAAGGLGDAGMLGRAGLEGSRQETRTPTDLGFNLTPEDVRAGAPLEAMSAALKFASEGGPFTAAALRNYCNIAISRSNYPNFPNGVTEKVTNVILFDLMRRGLIRRHEDGSYSM